MKAQHQSSSGTGLWQQNPALISPSPDEAVLSWLTEPGLLTARLRRLCGAAFRLQLVNETHQRAHATDLYRQVALCCGDVPCIFAESRIPLATANAHFWLRDLGKEPLGEKLQKRGDVTRGGFVYASLDPARLPEWIRPYAESEPLYARRSSFYIGDEELSVTEMFLPGIVNCSN